MNEEYAISIGKCMVCGDKTAVFHIRQWSESYQCLDCFNQNKLLLSGILKEEDRLKLDRYSAKLEEATKKHEAIA